MNPQRDEGRPLLQAIAELRVDVDRLIEEELQLLASSDGGGDLLRVGVGDRVRKPGAFARTSAPVSSTLVTAEPAEGDPGQRLDALARHLDGRLRRVGSRAETPDSG
jgi:hypothetical protein